MRLPCSSFYTTLVWLLAFAFCCYELHAFISIYQSYSTTKKVVIQHAENIRVPAIAACVKTEWQGTNYSQFFDRFVKEPVVAALMLPPLEAELVSAFNLSNGTYDAGPDVFVTWSESTLRFASIQQFARGSSKCITIKLRKREVNQNVILSNSRPMLVSVLFFKHSRSVDLSFYLLTPDHRVSLIDPQGEFRNPTVKPPRMFVPELTFQRHWTQLLPAPFDTDCRNYPDAGFESHDHCLDDCIKVLTTSRLGLVQASTHVYDAKELAGVERMLAKHLENETIFNSIIQIREECSTLCSQSDCERERFKPILMSTMGSRSWELAMVAVNAPNNPEIEVRANVKMNLLELIIMIFNSISFWTAFCPLDLAHKCIKLDEWTFVRAALRIKASVARVIRILIKFMLSCLCLLACIWQAYDNGVDYFGYPTVSHVMIQREALQMIPSLTVCISAKDMNASHHITLAELMRARHDPTQIIYSLSPGMREEKFLRANFICNTFHPESDTIETPDPRSLKAYSLSLNHTFDQVMKVYESKRTSSQTFIFYFHEQGSRIYGKYHSYIKKTVRLNSKSSFMTSLYKTTLLPPPYDTSCRQYETDSPFDSQHHCIESCAVNRSLSIYGTFPLFVSAAYEHLNVPVDAVRNMSTAMSLLSKCIEVCHRQDCTQNIFSARSSERITHAYSTTDKSFVAEYMLQMLEMKSAVAPAHVIKAHSIMNLSTFAINILGLIAFWTGITPYALLLSTRVITLFKRPFLPKRLHKAYVTVIILSSIAAYVTQIASISVAYFSYGTVTRMLLTPPDSNAEIPIVDFCHHTYSKTPSNLTLDQSFRYIDTSTYNDSPNRTITLKHYMVFGLMCHSINHSNSVLQESRPHLHDTYDIIGSRSGSYCTERNGMLCFGASEKLQASSPGNAPVFITMHDASVSAYDPDNNIVAAEPLFDDYRPTAKVSHRMVTQDLLPDPYDTHCLRYPVGGLSFTSARNCFESCYSTMFMKRFFSWPLDSPQFTAPDGSFLTPSTVGNDRHVKRMRATCSTRCRPDCEQRRFFTQLEFTSTAAENFWILTLLRSSESVVHIILSPRTSLLDLLYVILNGASFRFTFCPVTFFLSDKILNRLNKRTDRVSPESVLANDDDVGDL